MNKIIGILVVFIIIGLLSLIPSQKDYVYEEVVITNYRPSRFLENSVTTVKFPDGDVRICKSLPYRDNGEKLMARKLGRRFWRSKK